MRGVYIVRTGEFERSNEPVYKFGRSEDVIARMKSYPKGSKFLMFRAWTYPSSKSLVDAETATLMVLREHEAVRHRSDIGAEYFEAERGLLEKLVVETMVKLDAEEDRRLAEHGLVIDHCQKKKPKDPEELVNEFVRENEAELSGASIAASELHTRFHTFIEASGCQSNMKKAELANKLVAATGARSIKRRERLLVEQHLEFPRVQEEEQPSKVVLLTSRQLVEPFVRNRLQWTGEAHDHVSLKTLHDNYTLLCMSKGKHADKKSWFKETLVDVIGAMAPASNGERNFWKGWRLRPVMEERPPPPPSEE